MAWRDQFRPRRDGEKRENGQVSQGPADAVSFEDVVNKDSRTRVTSDLDLVDDDDDHRAEYLRQVVIAKTAANAQTKQELRLRGIYATVAGLAVIAQLADWFFYRYASEGVQWKVPNAVMAAWLAATVAQVVGVLLVITRNLFPKRDGGDIKSDIP